MARRKMKKVVLIRFKTAPFPEERKNIRGNPRTDFKRKSARGNRTRRSPSGRKSEDGN